MALPHAYSPPASSGSSDGSVVVTRSRNHRASLSPDLFTPPPEPETRFSSHGSAEHSPPNTVDLSQEVDEAWKTLDNIAALQFVMDHADGTPLPQLPDSPPTTSHGRTLLSLEVATPPVAHQKPFQKWMNTLRRRGIQRRRATDFDAIHTSPFRLIDAELARSDPREHRRHSSSGSSAAFVTAMKSPSVSLASFSVFGRSRRTAGVLSSKAHSRTDRSSRASAVRSSEDSQLPPRGILMDPAITERAMQRRRILEELISTEESYIRDVRFLMNVYVTILASLPSQASGLRSSINQNMTEIVELHEELLGELHRVVPNSEYTQVQVPARNPSKATKRGHHRWRSLDSVPEDNSDIAWLQALPGMTTEPQVAAEVAKIFISKMKQFFIYEEYGAKYELMIKDVTIARRTLADWEKYQKGLEALAASLGPEKSHECSSKKSSTVADLLVKPIQRVCKYPLLFAELLKYTPVVDCPLSHMVVEDALLRLREATAEINRATADPKVKSTLERTWNLQDRLVFASQGLDAASKNRIRSFGHIHLCGALHLCWQTKETVTGQYLICLLYRDWLCVATAGKADHLYTILVCIALANVKIENADNGRGLQCHTAPYSWKIVFECDHELYEIIMTACGQREYHEWRDRLEKATTREISHSADQSSFSALSINIKSLGTIFGKPGTIARRISFHRTTTVGPKTTLCQVILKNTTAERDNSGATGAASAKSSIQRSQSLLAAPASRVTVLSPSRGERIRLETLLADVWTRELLPFPGMTGRSRSEHLVRAGASSVMRKLSVASIASTFTKRSASMASTTRAAAAAVANESSSGLLATAATTRTMAAPTAWNLPKVISDTKSKAQAADAKSVATMPIHSLDYGDSSEDLGLTAVLSYSETALDKYTRAMESGVVATDPAEATKPDVCSTPRMRINKSLAVGRGLELSRQSSAASLGGCAVAAAIAEKASCPVYVDGADGTPVKENSRASSIRTPGHEASSPSSMKSGRRWGKVGALHRGVSLQGIRSFFR